VPPAPLRHRALSLCPFAADAKDWQGRVSSLRELSTRFRGGTMDEAELAALRDSKCASRLGAQLLDLRSEVTREATSAVTALAAVAAALPSFPPLVVEVLTPPLLRLVAVPHKVMSDQGHCAAAALFAAAPSARLLARLAEAQTDRRSPALLRARCAEYLAAALRCWPADALARDTEPLEAALLAGVGDAAPEVRARHAAPCAARVTARHAGARGRRAAQPVPCEVRSRNRARLLRASQVRRFSKASFELFRDAFPARAARLLTRMDASGAPAAKRLTLTFLFGGAPNSSHRCWLRRPETHTLRHKRSQPAAVGAGRPRGLAAAAILGRAGCPSPPQRHRRRQQRQQRQRRLQPITARR